jgi:hypothetical protein
MLGKEDEGQDEDLMENLESSVQHKERMLEASEGTQESHVLKLIICVCVQVMQVMRWTVIKNCHKGRG